MNIQVDLRDSKSVEDYSAEIFAEEGLKLTEEDAKKFSFLYENKWIGITQYSHRLASGWTQSQEFVEVLNENLEKAHTLEEATEALLTQLKLFGKQAVAEFVGVLCLLEAKANIHKNNDAIISEVRLMERSYFGYMNDLVNALNFDTNEDFSLIRPLNDEASGFIEWMFGVVDISLINRRELIKQALQSESYDELMLKLLITTRDLFEDASLLCGYLAVKLKLEKKYASLF
ncbi:hypothetical protein CIB87_02750 [Priestia megaterium]|uniref:Uncharacterized protein n=1 Tax=Priestia megaterium TaxID=1404 RepID=A0AA86I9L9_PRIMG|nr:hypothetical protein [Priestia megaterium]AXI27982.1 hypothetical protein CIB87_02750 [Priestia megaterium]